MSVRRLGVPLLLGRSQRFPRLGHKLLIPLHVRLQLLHLQLHGLTLLGHHFELRLCTLVMVSDLLLQRGLTKNRALPCHCRQHI